jgi:putative photosynthetic complex assembly protein 2
MEFLLPPVVALLVWWLGTGVVMLLDGLPRDTFRWSLATSTVIALGALVCIARSADNTTVAGAYAAFTCAVLAWGWHELAFLTGWLTGPRKDACSAPGHGPTRFNEAVQAILWHELAIIAMTLVIAALTWGGPNQVALWTFGLLWIMRLSAKLNLFLGVRNRGEEFLPPHLVYLGSYFRHRPHQCAAAGVAAGRVAGGGVDDRRGRGRQRRAAHRPAAGGVDAGAGPAGAPADGHPHVARRAVALGAQTRRAFAVRTMKPDPAPVLLARDGAPTAVVIGSGFGGLAAAIGWPARLARQVLEKLDAPGGRAYVFRRTASPSTPARRSSPCRTCSKSCGPCAGAAWPTTSRCVPIDPFYRIRFDDGSTSTTAATRPACAPRWPASARPTWPGYERFMARPSAATAGLRATGRTAFDSTGRPARRCAALVQDARAGAPSGTMAAGTCATRSCAWCSASTRC